MKLKKLFAGLISLAAALLAVCSITVFAGAYSSGDYIYAILDDGTVEITDYTGSATKLNIPATISGKKVTAIGRVAFEDCSSLTSVTLPDTVTSIFYGAFEDCSNLASINIPDSVTSIGSYAFGRCSSLTSINIPDSVTSIGSDAFVNCTSLTSINIPDSVTSIGSDAFYGTPLLENQTDSIKYVGKWVVDCDDFIFNATIKSGTVAIADEAFYFCSNLTSVTIPNGVTSIGAYALWHCSSLTSVSIPDSVTSIGEGAFNNCSSLTSIKIPDSVTTIESSAFKDCSNLISISIPDGITIIDQLTFSGCSRLTSVDIPDSVTSIGYEAFENCSSLTSIKIPDSVTTIDLCAFEGCSKLTSISIPYGVTIISDGIFRDCSSLSSVAMPYKATEIGAYAFENCSKLKSITIPDSVTIIETSAFAGTPFIDDQTSTVKYAGKWAVACDENATTVSIKSGTVGIADNAFYHCSNITSAVIPEGVKRVGSYAFSSCNLSSIKIPDGVTSIGEYAFSKCSNLVSVTLPDSITNIGDDAFVNTPLLDNQTSDVKYVGKWAVSCKGKGDWPIGSGKSSGGASTVSSYESEYIDVIIKAGTVGIADEAFYVCTNVLSVDIPAGVKYIGEETFRDCINVKSINIPDSVTSIGPLAFYNCQKLSDVYYSGSKSQWNKITVGEDNKALLNATIHFAKTDNAPSSVTGLKLKGRAADALRISWTKNTSADGYIIEMKSGNSWVRVGKITSNSTVEFKKSKLKAGTAYTFRVKAYKMDGKTALYGGYTTISARTNPSAITGLKLKARAADALRLTWTKNTSADGYIIEMKSGNTWTRVGKITKNSTVEFKKSKLKAGTAYTFRVKAYKMSGSTALYSATKTISVRTNPSAVSGLKLKNAAKDAVRLSWTKNTSADGYIIEMKVNGVWKRAGKIAKNSTIEFKKSGLKSKTSYTFRVKAYKMSGKTALYGATKTITVKTK